MEEGLTKQEVMIIVNRWIGVSGGYLGDFSYRTHADFYPEYCNLDFNPYEYDGTTRERFIEIITNATPAQQAKIVRGVLERFPLEEKDAPSTRTRALKDKLLAAAARIEGMAVVSSPNLSIASDVVMRAIADAEALLNSTGATSSVDRIHTALHGFLIAACDQEGIAYPSDPSLTKLYKILRNEHSGLSDSGARSGDISRILASLASVMDAFQPIRNRASVAHPNRDLLDKPEALLVINSARSILTYLNEKLGSQS